MTAEAVQEGLSESLQDYLEVVYFLVRRDRVARMRDIAARLGVGKSSVTGAIQALAERGLVHYDPYQFITLTPRGEAAGRRLLERHHIVKQFLAEVLAVPEAKAEAVGCKMEHAIKGEVLDRFVRFIALLQERRRRGGRWAVAFRAFRDGRRGAGGGRRKRGRKEGRK
jgi:DtxR family Mn-dependent transcriptional regulator